LSTDSVIWTLLTPVPRPASLNEVVSAPVLVLTLLSANRKCGTVGEGGLAPKRQDEDSCCEGDKCSVASSAPPFDDVRISGLP
jgi:hypothetical protein